MSVSIEGSGSITGVSTFNNATFSGITTFADNIDFDGNITGVTTFLGVGVTSLNVLGVSTFTGQLNAGTISATTLSATTVSIAGTLTYQDVTNIDSVGVVTARSGIHVTSGSVGIGTDNPDTTFVVRGDDLSKSIRFQANTSNQASMLFQNSTTGYGSGDGLYFGLDQFENGYFWHFESEDLIFGTADTERLRITSTGVIDASSNTTAVALPQGTTAQRPTGSAPYIRKNTTNNALEYFDGTSWVEIITDYFPTGSTIFG